MFCFWAGLQSPDWLLSILLLWRKNNSLYAVGEESSTPHSMVLCCLFILQLFFPRKYGCYWYAAVWSCLFLWLISSPLFLVPFMNALSPPLIFISSAFFLNEGSLHFQMKIRLLAKTYFLSPRYFLFCICGQWEILDLQWAQENILLWIHLFLFRFFFFESKNELLLWLYIHSRDKGCFWRLQQHYHLLVTP